MSTEVNLTPLYGSQDVGPVSSVLDIDGFKILLDCGWAEPFHPALLEPLRLYVPLFSSYLTAYSHILLHIPQWSLIADHIVDRFASRERIAPIIDLVVISAPDLHHMGGLPYAVSSFGLSVRNLSSQR